MLKKYAPYALILFFVLAVLPKFIAPINGLDAAWNYSNATNLSGDLFNHFTNNIVSNLYCYTQSFIAFGFPNQYGSILFHSLVLLGFILVVIGELRFSAKALFLSLVILTSYYFKLHRSEHVTLLITLVLYQTALKQYSSFYRIVLISFIIALLHPVHGLLAFIGLLVYEQSIRKNILQILLMSAVATLGLVAIHFLVPENNYSNSLLNRFDNVGIGPLLTFLKHGTITLVALFALTLKNWNLKISFNLLAMFVIVTLLGTANYYTFLFLPILLLALNSEKRTPSKPIITVLITISFLLNIAHPIFIQIENKSFAKTTRSIIRHNKQLSDNGTIIKEAAKMYTENYFAPPLFKNKNARMILVDKKQVLLVDSIEKGDIIMAYFKSKPQQIIHYLKEKYPHFTYSISERIPECQGNLTLTSLYQKRTESIGLWIITVN